MTSPQEAEEAVQAFRNREALARSIFCHPLTPEDRRWGVTPELSRRALRRFLSRSITTLAWSLGQPTILGENYGEARQRLLRAAEGLTKITTRRKARRQE